MGEVAAFEGVLDVWQVEQGVGDAQLVAGGIFVDAAGGVQPSWCAGGDFAAR